MIHLHTLGQCMISIGATRLVPTARMLFASALYVTIEGRRSAERDQMASLLWPELPEERATHAMRQMCYRLREAGMPLDVNTSRIALPDGSVRADFDDLLAEGSPCAVGMLLERIPGGFLPGYLPRQSPGFAAWVDAQRDRVNAALRRQLGVGIGDRRTAGDWPATEKLAVRCLELDPLNEQATLAYAESMAMDGSKARAVGVLDRYMSEVGPGAPELLDPAVALRKRILALYPLPPVIETEPPHIGREAEMETLDAALREARHGTGSAFVISGPPGIGKTRLVTEFTRAAQLQGIRVLRAQMGRHDDHRPLGAWTDLVPLMQRLPGALGCDPGSLPFLHRLTTYDASASAPPPDVQEAEYTFARIRMAILDLTLAVASESCLIVLIEDVHWMDEWSWTVMAALTKRLTGAGIVILMTRRESGDPATPIPAGAVLRSMPLAPLDDRGCRRLLGAVGPASRVSEEDFVEWCVRTCAGNPWFLVELARRASRADGRFVAPPSLTRLIAQRFAEVAPLSRRVLQATAVLGKNSTLARLERLLDERRLSLLDSLDELARHSLILSDGERVLCRHDLLGMSALSDISPLSLQLLHRHAAMALEGEIDERSTPTQLWDCAKHWEGAGEREITLAMMDRCATRAIAMGAPGEAVQVLTYALGLKPDRPLQLSFQRSLVRSLYATEDYPSLIALAKEIRSDPSDDESATLVHSPEELMEADAAFYSTGQSTDAVERLLSCARTAAASPDHRVEAATIASKIASNFFDADAIRAAFTGAADVLPAARPEVSEMFRLIYHGSIGPAESSAQAARRLLELVPPGTSQAIRAKMLGNCALALYANGEIDSAIECASEAVQSFEQADLPHGRHHSAGCLRTIYLATGDLDSVAAMFAADEQSGFEPGIGRMAHILEHRTRLAILQGNLDQARTSHEALLQLRVDGWPRIITSTTAIASMIRLMEGWTPTDEDMGRLLQLHHRARSFSLHDFFVYMLVHAYQARGEAAAAIRLAREYIDQHRLERGPLLRQLSERLENLSRDGSGGGTT